MVLRWVSQLSGNSVIPSSIVFVHNFEGCDFSSKYQIHNKILSTFSQDFWGIWGCADFVGDPEWLFEGLKRLAVVAPAEVVTPDVAWRVSSFITAASCIGGNWLFLFAQMEEKKALTLFVCLCRVSFSFSHSARATNSKNHK